ncbi:LysM peptidoglycan-binding domain-containing protein [candidate division KSB1 bacterium]|nr:LysM peptidoglycan-binding domain-containing protein [candidate division KSB1 bacterium]
MFVEFSKIFVSIVKVLFWSAFIGILLGIGVIGIDLNPRPVIDAIQSFGRNAEPLPPGNDYAAVPVDSEPDFVTTRFRQKARTNPQLTSYQDVLYYIVSHGETLREIAQHYRTTTRAIISLNRLKYPYRLRAGQTLLIPLDGILVHAVNRQTKYSSQQYSYHLRRKRQNSGFF